MEPWGDILSDNQYLVELSATMAPFPRSLPATVNVVLRRVASVFGGYGPQINAEYR
jgi:hypothetical protein